MLNYLQEINAFNQWLITNPSVSSDDIVLWYALMQLNNMCGWKPEFTVAISTIMDRTRLSRSAIYRSRNRLVQLERIRTTERSGNQCSIYQILPFASRGETQLFSVSPNGTQSETQSATQVEAINKLNYTKEKGIAGGSEAFMQQWNRWEGFRREKRKTLTATTIQSQINFLRDMSENEAIAVIEQSIKNGWQGLFPLKQQPTATPVIAMNEKLKKAANWEPTEDDQW